MSVKPAGLKSLLSLISYLLSAPMTFLRPRAQLFKFIAVSTYSEQLSCCYSKRYSEQVIPSRAALNMFLEEKKRPKLIFLLIPNLTQLLLLLLLFQELFRVDLFEQGSAIPSRLFQVQIIPSRLFQCTTSVATDFLQLNSFSVSNTFISNTRLELIKN